MSTDFRHGVSIRRSSKVQPPPVGLRAISAVGVVGTALEGPTRPRRIGSLGEGLALYGESGGTLPDALRAIFAQALVPVVAVNAFNADPAAPDTDLTAVDGEAVVDAGGLAQLAHGNVVAETLELSAPDSRDVAGEAVKDAAGTAQLAHGNVVAETLELTSSDGNTPYTLDTHYSLDPLTGAITRIDAAGSYAEGASLLASYSWIAGSTVYVAGTHYSLDPLAGAITRIDAAGSYAEGATLTARYKWADLDSVTAADIVGSDAAGTGLWALPAAETETALRPQVLCAPEWSQEASVSAAMAAVARRLQAALVADGPGTTEAAAIEAAAALGSPRALLVDPRVLVDPGDGTAPVERPASGYVAGAIARNDAENGFWDSPSNRPIEGIVGVSRGTDTLPGGSGDRLNAGRVATIARRSSGFVLWGSRVTADVAGPEKFLSVRRIMDRIEMALQESFGWAVDRNISAGFLESVAEATRAFIRSLQAPDVGAVLDGDCSPAGAEVNTDAALAAGRVYFNLSILPAVQAERIGFIVAVRSDYSAALLGVER